MKQIPNESGQPTGNATVSKASDLLPHGQSLYLDLIRFFMALEVMIGHCVWNQYTGPGFLWRLDPGRHLHTAVIGFFVLSGMVIAYAARTRETSAKDYAAARISRMHSVIIPALVLTWLVDTIGVMANPAFYNLQNFPTPIHDGQPWRYLASFLYLNNTAWLPNMEPGTNTPFWTMTYDVFYYAIFGVALFARGAWSVAGILLLCAAGGMSIVMYLPIWLLGLGPFTCNADTARGQVMPQWHSLSACVR